MVQIGFDVIAALAIVLLVVRSWNGQKHIRKLQRDVVHLERLEQILTARAEVLTSEQTWLRARILRGRQNASS